MINENAIAKLDVPIPQILVEVEMLEVSKGTADKIGNKIGSTPFTFKVPIGNQFPFRRSSHDIEFALHHRDH
jgi:hypothetical protein